MSMLQPALATGPAVEGDPTRRHVERVSVILVELWPLTAPEYDVVAEISAFVHGTMDRIGESFVAIADVACRKGCAWCCTVRVTATAPEIFNAARHIRQQRPELVARIAAESRVTDGLQNLERADLRRWCPLLGGDQACSIYEVRPTSCRAVMAPDAGYCLEGFDGKRDDFRFFARPMELSTWFSCAVMAALRGRGLAAEKYELTQALTIALADPGAEESWCAGGDPLAAARATDPRESDARDMLGPVVQALGGAR
jgi:Fe-S-cluster containining protein